MAGRRASASRSAPRFPCVDIEPVFCYLVSPQFDRLALTGRFSLQDKPMAQDILRFFRHCHFSTGEITRLRQIVRANGTSLILPYDQFVEHDARHREAESDAANPNYIMDLGVEGQYSAVAVHYGLSQRYWSQYDGAVPLIIKLNGKTSIPSDKDAFSTYTGYIEDAVRLGAVGVGYTLYYGSPRQDQDIAQLSALRKKCEEYGMPLIVWAYPRGDAIDAKGGRDSTYAVESATRMAMEMGASVIKANQPKAGEAAYLDNSKIPSYFRKLEKDFQAMPADQAEFERTRRVVEAAQGIPVLFSGGSETGEDDVVHKATTCVKAGCFGFIFGRNMWKRKKPDALAITRKLQDLLDESPGPLPAFAGKIR
ncbi:MAG: 2-amino-3,7-dideoxy-D-threo-hept-6-ulosonate synthase [Myxococcota bacterium]|nr:2-amino-3,7-dideoxy-D-threo-hept-6-ulosonate synthase [Myxococcota bacterium]